MAGESKLDFTNRMRFNSAWDRASLWMEKRREFYKEQGKTKKEANVLVWKEVKKEFPQTDYPSQTAVWAARREEREKAKASNSKKKPEQKETTIDEIIASLTEEELDALIIRSKTINLKKDREWVYRNIENPSAHARDAPSFGAWSLLKDAIRNPTKFHESIKPKDPPGKTTARVAVPDPKGETPAVTDEPEEVDETLEMTKELLENERQSGG